MDRRPRPVAPLRLPDGVRLETEHACDPMIPVWSCSILSVTRQSAGEDRGPRVTMRNQVRPVSAMPTKYWHALDDGRVQCDVCPRACKLREGQRGLCFVRAREGGGIVSTTYGRSSGYCVDPIEKKPLNHFLPGTPVLSFGTAGCNLACKFCQNWDMSKSRQMDTLADAASPRISPLHRCAWDVAALPLPTTTPSSSSSTPSTSPEHAGSGAYVR